MTISLIGSTSSIGTGERAARVSAELRVRGSENYRLLGFVDTPGATPQSIELEQKMLGELSHDEIRFLVEIKRYSSTLSDGDKRLVLAMIRKMATMLPPPVRKPIARRPMA